MLQGRSCCVFAVRGLRDLLYLRARHLHNAGAAFFTSLNSGPHTILPVHASGEADHDYFSISNRTGAWVNILGERDMICRRSIAASVLRVMEIPPNEETGPLGREKQHIAAVLSTLDERCISASRDP